MFTPKNYFLGESSKPATSSEFDPVVSLEQYQLIPAGSRVFICRKKTIRLGKQGCLA